jgi:DNA-binding transcriptional MerR regulator
MKVEKEKTYSIGDTAKMTGVSQKQIRNWEAKGYIKSSERVVSGNRAYRRFTLAQVETISKIKDHLEQGYTLAVSVKKATGGDN